jgi:hypothetical protein
MCLLRDACRALSVGARATGSIKELTSQDVLSRLQDGKTVTHVFHEIVNGGDVRAVGTIARTLLNTRLRYLKIKKGLPVPDAPSLEELLNDPTD